MDGRDIPRKPGRPRTGRVTVYLKWGLYKYVSIGAFYTVENGGVNVVSPRGSVFYPNESVDHVEMVYDNE
jgi:hypothetical protein